VTFHVVPYSSNWFSRQFGLWWDVPAALKTQPSHSYHIL